MLYFLSGLPRSGSTVLAAILNQHPDLYVSPTSGLIDLMGNLANSWQNNPTNAVQGRDDQEICNLLLAVAEAKYEHVNKEHIIDKSRGWPDPNIMDQMEQVLGCPPKIIATVRSVPDCAASFVRIKKPEDKDTFIVTSQVMSHLRNSYMTLYNGWKHKPENFCMIDYDELMAEPETQLDRIINFLGISDFKFDFLNIEGSVVKERDEEVWNIPGLHDVQPVLERQHKEDSKDVLGEHYQRFDQPQFWKGETIETKPNKLEDQYKNCLRGKFEEGWELIQELELENPTDNRVKYNKGWFLLRHGKLKEGLENLNFAGRAEGAFGEALISQAPLWDGKTPCTVLLQLEGGFGDQIHGVRYAKDIAARGCDVIVACEPALGAILKDVEGVKCIVASWAGNGVMHDMIVPSMMAPYILGYEYKNLSGKAYIQKPFRESNKKKKIGLKWAGNPNFPHDEYRRFPSNLLFDAVKDFDADFVSLQKEDAVDEKPDWVDDVSLNNWEETLQEIASCDLVISSCTSIAHLAAAMGVETWVVIPILSYFIWALPGDTSPYYDSVKLFRQTEFGDWTEPFNHVKIDLIKWIENK